jgi:hypothetical protein
MESPCAVKLHDAVTVSQQRRNWGMSRSVPIFPSPIFP